MKYIIVLLLTLSGNVFSQSYVVTNSKGEVIYSVTRQGNQAVVVDNRGYTAQNITIYPNQVVTPSGIAIGTPTYNIPLSPQSPPSPRVLQ